MQEAQDLVNILGAHPLALENAGAFIRKARITLREYQGLLEEYQFSLSLLASSDQEQRTVFTALELSFKRLEQEDLVASKLLTLLAFLHRSAFWECLISDLGGENLNGELSWLAERSKNKLKLINSLGKAFSVFGQAIWQGR